MTRPMPQADISTHRERKAMPSLQGSRQQQSCDPASSLAWLLQFLENTCTDFKTK